ncbi:hypothetical protein APHAL10511_008233 [Amanita phalloides]|nr:hypothetical protein APHAL10511_008233 [Amanita phalloides]
MCYMDMSSKRKQPDDPNLLQFNFESLVHNLRQQGLDGRDLATAVVWDIADRTGLTLRELKKHKPAAPSFSNASWQAVASSFDLVPSLSVRQLPIFTFPIASLPPSFHREVMKASSKWLDVYQERDSHNREAARVRLMDARHVPVCSLFKGRLVDKPESSMPKTPATSRGEVEHEVYMIQGIILLVFELKLAFKDERDHIAQVLLELDSAYKLNSDRDFRPQPSPVYAILTDLHKFFFFRYDGSQFSRTMPMFVYDERPEFLAGMRRVSEHLFSILLQGYIDTLGTVQARSSLITLLRLQAQFSPGWKGRLESSRSMSNS